MKEKMSKYPKKLVEKYFQSLSSAQKSVESLREPMDKKTIQDIVGEYLKDMQWHVKFDSIYLEFDPNYRFDLVARKEKRTIIVLAKPAISRQSMQEINEIFSAAKKIPSTIMIVATDIMELTFVLDLDSIIEMARKYRLGIFFVDKNPDFQETWLVPAEFLVSLSDKN